MGLSVVHLKRELEQVLNKRVDLVSFNGINRYLKRFYIGQSKNNFMRDKKIILSPKSIKDAIEKINAYVTQHKYDEFVLNEWDQAAIIRYFEIIGEAVSNIDEEFKKTLPDIEWRDMSDFRNFLIHDYMDIDVQIVWRVMTIDIPILNQK